MPSQALLQLVIETEDRASAALRAIGASASAMGGAAQTAGLALAGIAAAGAAGFAALTAAGIKLNATMEQTTVGFTTLLGSAQAAGSFMQELKQFAASTPFEFPDLARSSRQLLAYGIEAKNIIPLMTAVGDAVGAMGGGAFEIDRVVRALGQMQAKGKVASQELLQLSEVGIPGLQLLAEGFGVSTGKMQDMISKGIVPADQAIGILAAGFEQRFGGSMAAQAQTFNGLLSTLRDNASFALQAFSGPLFDQAKAGLLALGNLVASPAFQQFAADMGQKVGGAFATIVSWISPVVTGFYQIGAAILSSSDPIATILDLLDTLIPGFADAASAAYTWGANIVSQLAAGMAAAINAVLSVISTIASIIAYWFAPGSPPKVAPEIDQWGAAMGSEFFAGVGAADTSPLAGMTEPIAKAFTDLSGQMNSALQNMVDIGALDQLARIPALQAFRGQIAGALQEIDQFGSVSDTTWANVTSSLGPVAGSMTPVIRGYLAMAAAQGRVAGAQDALDGITAKYKKQLDGLETQLKSVQRAFDTQLRPFNAQLDALSQQEDAIKRVQRAQDARATLDDPNATGEEKALARLELQRIELEKQMAPIQQARDAAVQSIRDQIDAAQVQRDAEVSAAQATLDTYTAQLDAATALYQNEQARVGIIQSSNSLFAEQARLVEQAAKAAEQAATAGGGGGGGAGKKVGGGGGLKLPAGGGLGAALGGGLDLTKLIPDGAQQQLADAGTAIEDVRLKIASAKQTIEGWKLSWDQMTGDIQQKLAPVIQLFGTLKDNFTTIAGVIAGVAAGFAAFSVLSTIAGWIGGLSGAFAFLSGVIATVSAAVAEGFSIWAGFQVALGGPIMTAVSGVVAALGGPLTIAIAAIAVIIGALVAAWVTNFGGIRDATTQAWAQIQPVFAQLLAWMGAQIPPILQALAALWTTVLQPALLVVAQFIAGTLIPAIADVVVWLGANIPVAIQAASDFWTTTLQPALAVVGGFISSSIIPLFTTVVQWLATTIPAAVATVAGFWTGTLQPALAAVWGFIQTSIIPLFDALANVWIAALKLEIRLLASFWTDTLQPALSAVWNVIQTNVIPILDTLGTTALAGVRQQTQPLVDLWNTTLKPALETIAAIVRNTVIAAFDDLIGKIGGVISKIGGIKGAIDSAVGWLNNLASKINGVNTTRVAPGSGTGGGSSGDWGGSAGGGGGGSNRSARSLAAISRAAQQAALPLDGVTDRMQQLATAMSFVAERARDVAIWDTIRAKTQALQGDAKTTAALYAQLGQNVKFLADAATTYKQVENKDSKGRGVGTFTTEVDQAGLEASQLSAFTAAFDQAARDAYAIQQRYGQAAARAYYESQSKYLQDEATLQIAYNQETDAAKKAAIKEQMTLRWRQNQAELAALEAEQGAALDAIAAEQAAAAAAYQERMQQIQDIFNAQKKANLQGAADLYTQFADTAGAVGDMLGSAYQDAYDQALDGLKPPDVGTQSNADLEAAYAAYDAKIKEAQAAGQAAQQQVQQVQQQLLAAQQKALEISKIDPQAAADYYKLQSSYIMRVNDLRAKLAGATTDAERQAIQQQLDYLAQAQGFQEQLFQANLDQYGKNLQDAQQAAQDAASATGDTALQTYADQIGEMFTLFQQQLSKAVIGATGAALGLPGMATMPNLTARAAQAPPATRITLQPGAVIVNVPTTASMSKVDMQRAIQESIDASMKKLAVEIDKNRR